MEPTKSLCKPTLQEQLQHRIQKSLLDRPEKISMVLLTTTNLYGILLFSRRAIYVFPLYLFFLIHCSFRMRPL